MPHFRRAAVINWPHAEVHIYPVFDCHTGSLAADEELQRKLAAIIADDPYALAVGGGDNIECISYKDWRFEASELARPILAEHLDDPYNHGALRFAKVWQKTKGKWAMWINGNHELSAMKASLCNPTARIVEQLGGQYAHGQDQCGWILLRMTPEGNTTRGRVIKIYVQHGWGGGETRGSDANKMQRLLWRKQCDLLLMGHSHRPMHLEETVEYLNSHGKVLTKSSHAIMSYALISKHGYLARKGGNEPPKGYYMYGCKLTGHQWAKMEKWIIKRDL